MAAQLSPSNQGLSAKKRQGLKSTWNVDNIHFTQTLEIVPSKTSGTTAGQKRRLETVLIRYTIANKDTRARTVGARMRMDALCVDNDGALFAAPTRPGQILNGVELKGKELPPYAQILQRADLKNPGFVGHFTLKMSRPLEGPDRFIATMHGARDDGWNLAVTPAQGDSDAALFWEPKPIPAGGKRELAYAYGKGLASNLENEGKVTVAFGGSFAPNKVFTITAYVDEPLESQTLQLDLPSGLERLEGKEIQPVPPPSNGTSVVFWKARVLTLGEFTIRLKSSSGQNWNRTITVSR